MTNANRRPNRLIAALVGMLILIVSVAPADAQRSYPMLMSIDPVAAQTGTQSEHVVRSRYTMEGAYEVLVSGEGVTGQVVLPEADPNKDKNKKPSPLQTLTLRFQVASGAMAGVRDFRIATPSGVSTVGQLVIVNDPVVVEASDNNTIETATEATIPSVFCGRLEKAEDVDYFKFHADEGEQISFHVRCMRLQDRIHDLQQHADPIVSIRNASGSTLAAADNTFAADPQLTYTFAEAGDYYLELRDVRYQGNQYWGYCVEANRRPFVHTVFPLGVASGETTSLRLIGEALGESDQGEVSMPSGPGSIQPALVSIGDGNQQPVSVVVTDLPVHQEGEEANDAFESAMSISAPASVNGVIETEADQDCFVFDAKKGQRFTVEVIARRAGSMLDPHLRILNEKGSQQQLNDDMRVGKRNFADSRIENWTVPADGKYVLEVRDVHLRGGPGYVYVLNVTPSSPHFNLFADTDKTPLTPGTSGVVYVRAEKKNGFDSEIQLRVDDLPEGVTATCGRILTGKSTDGCIVLTAAADAKPIVGNIRISGIATLPDGEEEPTEITADATIYQETYQPGGGRGHWPVLAHAVSIGTPGDIRRVTLSSQELTIKPGESTSIDVEIERAEGFEKNVTLEVTYKHLSTTYGNSLPPGITVDPANSKLLLTAGASKGKITLKAATDAQPVERQQFAVMANVSINFVMKATYASAPVFLTVEK